MRLARSSPEADGEWRGAWLVFRQAPFFYKIPRPNLLTRRVAHTAGSVGAAAATMPAVAAWMCSAAAPALPLMGSEAAGRLRSVPAGAAIARHPRTGFRT